MEPQKQSDDSQGSPTPLQEKQWVSRVWEEWDRPAFEMIFRSYSGEDPDLAELRGAIQSEIDQLPIHWASLKEDWTNIANTPFRFFKNASYEGGTRPRSLFPTGRRGTGDCQPAKDSMGGVG